MIHQTFHLLALRQRKSKARPLLDYIVKTQMEYTIITAESRRLEALLDASVKMTGWLLYSESQSDSIAIAIESYQYCSGPMLRSFRPVPKNHHFRPGQISDEEFVLQDVDQRCP